MKIKYLGKKSLSSLVVTILNVLIYGGIAVVWLYYIIMGILAVLYMNSVPGVATFFEGTTFDLAVDGFNLMFSNDIIKPVDSLNYQLWMSLCIIPAMIGEFYILIKVRAIFRTFVKETPFCKENFKNLRHIGVAFFAYTIAEKAGMMLAATRLMDKFDVNGLAVGINYLDVLDYRLLFALVLIVLGAVFEHGQKLEEEQELTI